MPRLAPRSAALLVTALAFHVDMLLYYMLVPLLPRYAHDMHLSQMQVSVLFGSYAAALLLATFPVGRITDRYGRRAPMLAGLIGLAITTLVFAYSRHFVLLLIARSLQGVAGSLTWMPGMALLADHFPSESRGKAMGTAFAAANLGALLGPPVAGFLVEHGGPRAPFLLGIGLVLLDAYGRAFLLPEAEPAREPSLSLRALLARPGVRLFAGAMALGSGLWSLLESTLPLDFDRRLHASPKIIGLAFAGAALAHTLTSPWMGALSDRIGRVRVLRMGLVFVALLLPLPALLPGVWTAGLAMMALGSAASFLMSPCSPAMAEQVEQMGSQAYASGFAVLNLAYSVGMMIGPYLGGAAVTLLGLVPALGAAGMGYAAMLWATRGVRA